MDYGHDLWEKVMFFIIHDDKPQLCIQENIFTPDRDKQCDRMKIFFDKILIEIFF